MLVKLIYVLFFAAFNFVSYSKLNKTGKISPNLFWISILIFIVLVILHTGLFNWSFLMARQDFLLIAALLFVPVIVYIWFNFLVLKRIRRLNMSNERFRNTAIKIFSFFFLKFFYVMVFIAQCGFIFTPVSSLHWVSTMLFLKFTTSSQNKRSFPFPNKGRNWG